MLQKRQMMIASELTRRYNLESNVIVWFQNLTCLICEPFVAPKPHFNSIVTLLKLIEHCDGWRNVAARPPADCEYLHVLSPLSVHV